MKTEQEIRDALGVMQREVVLLTANQLIRGDTGKAMTQMVGTLLWTLGDSTAALDDFVDDCNDRFEVIAGSVPSGKYGWIMATGKAFHPNEPVFILRATDRLAPKLVQEYGERCVVAGCDAQHVEAVFAHAKRIREWQEANPNLVKKPD